MRTGQLRLRRGRMHVNQITFMMMSRIVFIYQPMTASYSMHISHGPVIAVAKVGHTSKMATHERETKAREFNEQFGCKNGHD